MRALHSSSLQNRRMKATHLFHPIYSEILMFRIITYDCKEKTTFSILILFIIFVLCLSTGCDILCHTCCFDLIYVMLPF